MSSVSTALCFVYCRLCVAFLVAFPVAWRWFVVCVCSVFFFSLVLYICAGRLSLFCRRDCSYAVSSFVGPRWRSAFTRGSIIVLMTSITLLIDS